MAFEGPVFLANKIGKIMRKINMIDCIQYGLCFQFQANWTRLGGVINVWVWFC